MFSSEEDFMQGMLTSSTEDLENALYLIETELRRREDEELDD